MHDKIILGTANFTQSYGILSDGHILHKDEVLSILNSAYENKIRLLDTALSYGDIFAEIQNNYLKKFNIIIKFSILDDASDILKKANESASLGVYGVMVHDPQNLHLVSKNSLLDLFHTLRQSYGVKKIGVSVYDMQQLDDFIKIAAPDIIQIPLNPFNQIFDNRDFKTYIKENEIEIHARSLFLQGVLLSEKLPDSLKSLDQFWLKYKEIVKLFPSSLQALLSWALNKEWIDKWVIGVESVNNLKEIMEVISSFNFKKLPCFDLFKTIQDPMIDPRNWRI